MEGTDTTAAPPVIAAGEKSKARDIIAAIRTLQTVEREQRPPNTDERSILARFGGFGAVALSIFPDPVTGRYKDAGWQALGDELKSLLSPEEYDSAQADHLQPVLHVADGDRGHAPGGQPPRRARSGYRAGTGLRHRPFPRPCTRRHEFIGVELDGISGRIARALHPDADIRIENFRDTKLTEGSLDAVIGNPPFGDVKLDYRGQKLPLHDFFVVKSFDALKPGGILAVVTTHFTLDKQNAATREHLAGRADFLGAIRLPSEAFKREGTSVVTDILFLRKRALGEPARHADPEWLATGPLSIEGVEMAVNQYFLNHPEQVLGDWSRKDRLYGGDDGYSVTGNGILSEQLDAAIRRLPELAPTTAAAIAEKPVPAFTPPPPERHIGEGSFFIGDDRTIHQVEGGQGVPVVYGGTTLKADGTMTGKPARRPGRPA